MLYMNYLAGIHQFPLIYEVVLGNILRFSVSIIWFDWLQPFQQPYRPSYFFFFYVFLTFQVIKLTFIPTIVK